MIKAISFDLWDTVIHDDSDEPKRTALGLKSKPEARRDAVFDALCRIEPLPRERLDLAYDVMESAFRHVWHEQHVTWTVHERLAVLLGGLGRTLPADALDAVARTLEEMEIAVMPDAIEGAAPALEALAQRYRLGVVSDAIYTPGRCLRTWLERNGLRGYFSGFAFSDEVGHSKPHREMFSSLATQLEVSLPEMVHVGDRDHNDVKGPHALGMKAILFTATRDRDAARTTADAVCASYAELPSIIDRLAAG